MKKLILILLSSLFLLLSCDNSTTEPRTPEAFEGTWVSTDDRTDPVSVTTLKLTDSTYQFNSNVWGAHRGTITTVDSTSFKATTAHLTIQETELPFTDEAKSQPRASLVYFIDEIQKWEVADNKLTLTRKPGTDSEAVLVYTKQ